MSRMLKDPQAPTLRHRFYKWVKSIWMKDAYSQWVYREMRKVRSEVRAGKELEESLGLDWKFGKEVYKRGWKGPAVIVLSLWSYFYFRIKYDDKWVYKQLGNAKTYKDLKNFIEKVEFVRGKGFREQLFINYELFLENASSNPMETLEKLDLNKFEEWCDWMEQLRYETKKNTMLSEKINDNIQKKIAKGDIPFLNKNTPKKEFEQMQRQRDETQFYEKGKESVLLNPIENRQNETEMTQVT